jgi:proteasome lid subunit RPN8/RPN11
MSFRLLLSAEILQAIVDQARAELPNECCGLLAGVLEEDGKVGRVVKRYPLINEAASRVEFWAEPLSQLAAQKDMDRSGLEHLATYHSHPTSEAIPSQRDRERSVFEEVMCMIVSLQSEPAQVRCWWLTGQGHREASWSVVN